MLETRLVPDQLPYLDTRGADVSVLHKFPDAWDDTEIDLHRFDDCPCLPTMLQELGQGRAYRWWVDHQRRLSVA